MPFKSVKAHDCLFQFVQCASDAVPSPKDSDDVGETESSGCSHVNLYIRHRRCGLILPLARSGGAFQFSAAPGLRTINWTHGHVGPDFRELLYCLLPWDFPKKPSDLSICPEKKPGCNSPSATGTFTGTPSQFSSCPPVSAQRASPAANH